jgi:predicted chitinase
MANHGRISQFENITWSKLQQKWRARIRHKGITLDKLKADAIAKTRQYMYEYMYQDNYRTGKFKLGNDKLGDGIKYIGRGYIQLTGKPNYKEMGKKLGLDLLNQPELVETQEVAAKVSIDFWFTRKCRTPAQRGDVPAVTQIINGGQNGIADRTKKYHDYLTDANLGRFDLAHDIVNRKHA